jgi:hypothetical protein
VRAYCTYFDSGYLTRGLALLESLRAHARPFRLFVLCMDETSHDWLKRLAADDVEVIALADFEAADPELLAVKSNRSRIEYYFTCTPSLPRYILASHPELDGVTYVDADLYFFSSPEALFQEIGASSVAIISHRFPPALEHHAAHGKYNVGFLFFRRSVDGLECLDWWRQKCIEWCYDVAEPHRYADQKYLDDWPTRFSGVVELAHKGANVAPWNVGQYSISERSERVFVDDAALVFFHFHGLKEAAPHVYDPQLARYLVTPASALRKMIYRPYLNALARADSMLRRLGGSTVRASSIRQVDKGPIGAAALGARLSRAEAIVRGALRGRLIIHVGGHVL